MKVIAAYSSVVMIWATTPLAIKWSNSTLSFIEGVTARMSFAMVGALLIAALLDKRIFQSKKDWKPMLVGAFKMYPVMLLVYWSAQYIPSGLISVVFGATPFFVGVFSIFVLGENHFNSSRLIALVIALIGLSIIHIDQLSMGPTAAWGVAAALFSTMLFALSTVGLKKVGGSVEPVRQLAGSLVFAAPCFLVTWLLVDGDLPAYVDMRSISGVVYLVIAGSIVGGLAFYYVLRQCSVSTVSLIPLITPVAALIVGYIVEGETVATTTLIGAICVLFSLAIYQGVSKIIYCWFCQGKSYTKRRVNRFVFRFAK